MSIKNMTLLLRSRIKIYMYSFLCYIYGSDTCITAMTPWRCHSGNHET